MVAVNVIVYLPGVEKLTSGNFEVLVVPFTKLAAFGVTDQDHAFGKFVDRSIKDTTPPTEVAVTLALKSATGKAETLGVIPITAP